MKAVKKIFVFAMVAGILSSGCTTIKRTIPLDKGRGLQHLVEEPLVSHELLQEKVDELSSRIEEYKALEKELKKEEKEGFEELASLQRGLHHAGNLAKIYKQIDRLQEKLLASESYSRERKIYRTMIEKLFQGLTGLEEGYFEEREEVQFAGERSLNRCEFDLNEIERHCVNKDYMELIDSYKKAETTYSPHSIPEDIRLCYADALYHTNQVKEAIRIIEEVIARGTFDSLELRSNLINWYIEIEDHEKALDNIEKLSNELDRNRGSLLISRKKIEEHIPGGWGKTVTRLQENDIFEEDIKPVADREKEVWGGEITQEEDEKKSVPEEESAIPLDGELKETGDLIDQHKPGDEHGGVTGPKGSSFDTPYRIKGTENVFETVRIEEDRLKAEEEKERFMMARNLIESEEYEKAIRELDKLKGSEKYGMESREMIERSIDEFARKRREEAAKLFLMAKNRTDSSEKKELLLRSFELLKEVIEKYPLNSYSGKIMKNIESVKEEIIKVDPYFYPEESS